MCNRFRFQVLLPVVPVLLGVLAAVGLADRASAATSQDTGRVRYVAVGAKGAKARNLFDKSGLVVNELDAGTVIAVHAEKGGWLQAEVPGGFRVWVYGQYVRSTAQSGVLEITGSEVRQRPIPSSGDNAYPLVPNLARGERVRLIQRNDAGLPLERDWVQVWTPPGVRAWVHSSDTVAMPAGVDGASAWAEAVVAVKKARTPVPVAGGAGGGSAVSAGAPLASAGNAGQQGGRAAAGAMDLVREADDLLARERGMERPDFASVRAAYGRALADAGDGPAAEIVRSRLKEVDAYAEAVAIRDQLEGERERRADEIQRRRDAMDRAASNTDPFAGRFDARGWLELRRGAGRSESYVLVWSGKDVAELVCNTGRYNLSMFENFQVGVTGFQTRGGRTAAGGVTVSLPVLDASRLEVLAGRFRDR